ncbi:MAG: hypothetical protein HYU28_12415 [Actinobacteria bacterium]|nr:hypothetical protein [Actinomycetota bacterium]
MNTTAIRRAMAAVGLAAAIVPGVSTPAKADAPPSGSDVVEACEDTIGAVPMIGGGTCRGVEQLARDLAQVCRFTRSLGADTPEAACSTIDGRVYSEEAMAAYEASWTHQALALQARLDDTTALRYALVPATHNSFNTATQPPTLSGLDHNQVASLTDQLRMDMRGLEVDVHWFPSPEGTAATGFKAPVTCHAQDQGIGPIHVHIGCTAEQTLSHRLDELAAWVDAHPGEFVLLYLENALEDDPLAHDTAGAAIAASLGDRVYRPPAGQACAPMPTALSERQILDSPGSPQILIVGNCDTDVAGAWGTWVHERDQGAGTWAEDKSDVGDDFACADGGPPDTFRRFYEDSTWVSHTVEPTGQGSPGEITVAETSLMVRCGVNLFGFDQLVPADPRLPALVWSWAPDQPARGNAAVRQVDGRFRSAGAGESHPYACRDTSGGWHVTAREGAWARGPAACAAEFAGSAFAVPPTAVDNDALGAAGASTADVWLNYARRGGTWIPR